METVRARGGACERRARAAETAGTHGGGRRELRELGASARLHSSRRTLLFRVRVRVSIEFSPALHDRICTRMLESRFSMSQQQSLRKALRGSWEKVRVRVMVRVRVGARMITI